MLADRCFVGYFHNSSLFPFHNIEQFFLYVPTILSRYKETQTNIENRQLKVGINTESTIALAKQQQRRNLLPSSM